MYNWRRWYYRVSDSVYSHQPEEWSTIFIHPYFSAAVFPGNQERLIVLTNLSLCRSLLCVKRSVVAFELARQTSLRASSFAGKLNCLQLVTTQRPTGYSLKPPKIYPQTDISSWKKMFNNFWTEGDGRNLYVSRPSKKSGSPNRILTSSWVCHAILRPT